MGKLTDKEIICALECISTFDCEICVENKCSYYTGDWMRPCNDVKIAKDALDLINRQRAENERYKGVINILEKDVAKTKVETTKEFAKYLVDNDEDGVIKTIDLPELVCDFLHPVEKVVHDSLCETETYKAREE